MNLSVEHVLMVVLVVCALHYLMRNCGCRRVEGISNRKEGACCNMGECGDGLECNVTAMNSECLNDPANNWYGRCQKNTHWMRKMGLGPEVDFVRGIAPMNKKDGDCCHSGDCGDGLLCDPLDVESGKCKGGWTGECRKIG